MDVLMYHITERKMVVFTVDIFPHTFRWTCPSIWK